MSDSRMPPRSGLRCRPVSDWRPTTTRFVWVTACGSARGAGRSCPSTSTAVVGIGFETWARTRQPKPSPSAWKTVGSSAPARTPRRSSARCPSGAPTPSTATPVSWGSGSVSDPITCRGNESPGQQRRKDDGPNALTESGGIRKHKYSGWGLSDTVLFSYN